MTDWPIFTDQMLRAKAQREVFLNSLSTEERKAAEELFNTPWVDDDEIVVFNARHAAVAEAIAFLEEIGTPISGERTEHERGIMYAARRLAERESGKS